MMLKLFPVGVLAAVAVLIVSPTPSASAAEFVPEAYGFADAQAHDVVDEDPGGIGPSFSDTASAVSNPLNRTPADASASASAYGDAFGPFGVTAAIAGYANNPDPTGRNDVTATSSSANYVQYLVTAGAGSLNPGDTVRARLTLNFKGTLEIIDGNTAVPDESGLRAYLFTDTQIGQNLGQMDIIHEGEGGFDAGELYEWGDFEGHGVFTHDAATGRHAAAYDFTDVVEFDTTIGSTVELSFNYWADAKLEEPLNMSALIDFSAGTTYTLTAADAGTGAQFVAVVPEPAALSLIAFGALATLRRRHR